MKNKYNLSISVCLSMLLVSCSAGGGGSSSPPNGSYGKIEFNPSSLNMAVGTLESVTITLVNSTLSPGLTIPLSTSTNGIVMIPNECQLGGVPPGPWGNCTFTVQAITAGKTNIIAGWPDWPATNQISVVVQ